MEFQIESQGEGGGRPVDLDSSFEIESVKSTAIPAARSAPQIIFFFTTKSSVYIWESHPPQRVLLSRRHRRPTSAVSVNLAQFHDAQQQTFSLIKQKTESVLLHARFYEILFSKLHAHAVETLVSMLSHSHIFIHSCLNVNHHAIIRPTPIAAGLIPADESSIKSLPTINVAEGSCSVCLEEFCEEEEEEGASMPCAHVFHRNCITKWLKINRNCPLCRFEMPTATAP